MAEPGQEDQDDLKKKLVRRIAIAGVLVVVLLGGLTLVEDYLVEKPSSQAPTAKPEVPPVPDKAGEKPADEQKAEPQAGEKPAEAPAEPEKTETPLAPAPEAKAAPHVVIKAGPAAPATAEKKVEHASPRAAASPAPSADPATVIARSYRLQMGVFTTASNAEELHAKLEKAGIPAYVESRVHVGPFRTQKEADEARRRLKELGLGPGLLIPPQKK